MEEELGVKAIIFLQKMAGKEETVLQARAGWGMMNDLQRQNTLAAYEALKEKVHR